MGGSLQKTNSLLHFGFEDIQFLKKIETKAKQFLKALAKASFQIDKATSNSIDTNETFEIEFM